MLESTIEESVELLLGSAEFSVPIFPMRRVGGTLLHKNSQYIRGRVQCEQASLHPWVPQTRTGDAVFRGRRDQTQHIGTDPSYRLDGIQRCEIFVPGMAVLDTCRGATLSTVPFLEATETKSAEFSAKHMSPDPQEDKEEDYYANMGDAIRTLREDIPQLFRKEFDCTLIGEVRRRQCLLMVVDRILVLQIVFIARISYSRILDWSLGALRITRLYCGP